MTTDPSHFAAARELLPCSSICGTLAALPGTHSYNCPAAFRPAVAEALAAKDAAVAELASKLEFALQFIYCEECVFTFPDGDTWDAGSMFKDTTTADVLRMAREALKAMRRSHGMHGPCRHNSCRDCTTAYTQAGVALDALRAREGT